MKKSNRNFKMLLCTAILGLLSGTVELDNYLSGIYTLKKSFLFHLPVAIMIQMVSLFLWAAFTAPISIFLIKHMKKKRPKKPKELKHEDGEYRLTFKDHDKSHRYL